MPWCFWKTAFLSALVAQKHESAGLSTISVLVGQSSWPSTSAAVWFSCFRLFSVQQLIVFVCYTCSTRLCFRGNQEIMCVCIFGCFWWSCKQAKGHRKRWKVGKQVNTLKKKKRVKKEHSMKKRWLNNLLGAAFKCNLKILEASQLHGDHGNISFSESC